jgi:DNA topoisomerase-1
MRLRRSDPREPGYGRRRRGRGFSYHDERGRALTDPGEIRRCRELVIPPAWTDVWICPDPAGHLQALGTDAAGRRQYLYHPLWRQRRDRRKFDHVLKVAERLPRLRRRVAADLATAGLTRRRVLALAVRLIDRGLFRVGSDRYAAGDAPTYGVSTVTCADVTCQGTVVRFCYRGKGGIEHEVSIVDAAVAAVVRQLLHRRRRTQRLLAHRCPDGQWRDVHSSDINEYVRAAAGVSMTVKDLRTWHATVIAASRLSRAGTAASPTGSRRVVARVVKAVAKELGNTPTVARASYVDPRVIELYRQGEIVALPGTAPADGPAAEREVLRLLKG